ncbi:MAG: ABC transporter substrate-binding protein [Dehalococcoidia bacterium]|nr:ABC transporter substrate-binding protein [Dehalococcoidia bacterium]
MPKVFHEILKVCVEIPEPPKRIASLYPSVTETLVDIGIGEELVGVSSHCHFFVTGLKKKPVSSVIEVNYKLLEEMKPDLVLTTTGIQRQMAIELHSRGYQVFPIPLAFSLYGIIANVLLVGALVGKQREARQLGEQLARELETSRVQLRHEDRPRVYIEIVWPDKSSTTVGGLAFINDLISTAGGCNVFSEKPVTYFTPNFKDIAAANPDFILIVFEPPLEMKDTNIASLIKDRGWEETEAVKKDKIALTTEKDLPLTHSGPSAIKNIRLLSEKLREFGLLAV